MIPPERRTRLAAVMTLTFTCLSIAILVGVGAAGPSAATVRVYRAGGWPPWFASLHPSDLTVTAVLWVALFLGAAGVAAGLVAVRRGWRPPARWLVAGALVAVIVLAVVPAVGSTDMLDYAAYGRIAVLHHSPYLMTPGRLRAAHDPVGLLAPYLWQNIPTVYGPLATATEWAASELGGRSAAVTIFWLKVWNGVAFVVVVLALDWLTRARPAMRARAHLLWSVNPLMLWAVMAGGHVDGLAVGIAVLALAVLGRTVVLAREPGRIGLVRALGSGLLLGAATAVKAPFVLFGAGLAWVARRSPRTLAAAAAGGAAMLAAAYLAAGRDAVTDTVNRGYGVAGDNLWQVFYRLVGFGPPFRHITLIAALAFVALAVLLIRRPPPGALDLPVIWPVLAAVVAWTFTSSQQRPWYDVMIYLPLVFLPPSRLDWVVLGRSVAGGIAYIPGVIVSHLHPAWLQAGYTTVVAYVTPSGRLLALAALIVLCLTGAWNRQRPSGEAVSQPDPGRPSARRWPVELALFPLTHRVSAGVVPYLLCICNFVMVHGQVALDQELLVVRVEDCLLDVLASEGLNCGPGLPEAHRDELGMITLHTPKQPGPAVAGRALIALDAGLLYVRCISGSVLRPDRPAPSSRDHPPILAHVQTVLPVGKLGRLT